MCPDLRTITVRHLLVVGTLAVVAAGPARSTAHAQTEARGRYGAEERTAPPLIKSAGTTRGQNARTNAGGLLWEDRYDASDFEQAFSVATLNDLTFVAGYVAKGFGRDFVVRAYRAATGTLAWQDRLDRGRDEFASGVVTAQGRVFVSGTASRRGTGYDWILRAYDAATGHLLWEDLFDLARRSDFSRGTALAASGDLVFLGGYGTNANDVGDFNTDYIVRAHDAATGALVWEDRLEGYSGAYSIALDDDRVFVGGWMDRPEAERAIVRAYDARSGTRLWEQLTDGAPFFLQTWTKSIRATDGRVFVAQVHRDTSPPFKLTPLLQAYDAATGARLWTEQFDTGAENEWLNELDVFGGRVFVVGTGGPGCVGTLSNCDAIVRSYDAIGGTLQWERQLDLSGADDEAHLVLAARGAVFVLSQAEATFDLPGCCAIGQWVVQAFDTSHGQLLWQSVEGELESGVYNMAVERGRLFIPGRAVDRATGAWDFIVRAYDVRGRQFEIEPAFSAPRRLVLTGASGKLSYEVTFEGTLTAAAHGLIPADEHAGAVSDDPLDNIYAALATGVGVTLHPLSVPAGTRHLRVALFDEDTDGADDLDLYVLDNAGNIIAASGGSTSSAELVDLSVPAAGDYIIAVHGYETDGPDASYTLFTWALGDPAAGNLTVTGPEPSNGPSGTVTLHWLGLTPGVRYFGAVSYAGGSGPIPPTLVSAGR